MKIKLRYTGKQEIEGMEPLRLWDVIEPRFPQFDYSIVPGSVSYPTMGIEYMRKLGVLK